MGKEETSIRIMWIAVRLTELVVGPVIATPTVQTVLEVDINQISFQTNLLPHCILCF